MVRLLTSIAGAPAYHAGDVIETSPAIEIAWVSAGIAERVGDESEQAVVGPPETAMRRRKGRRRA